MIIAVTVLIITGIMTGTTMIGNMIMTIGTDCDPIRLQGYMVAQLRNSPIVTM